VVRIKEKKTYAMCQSRSLVCRLSQGYGNLSIIKSTKCGPLSLWSVSVDQG